jgi:predicted  nucleic acid-binding Zn-ribbon protein
MEEKKKCLVVTCLPCDTPDFDKEVPNGCCNCGMLDWLCFTTEEEANSNYKKQFPHEFDINGNYINLKVI